MGRGSNSWTATVPLSPAAASRAGFRFPTNPSSRGAKTDWRTTPGRKDQAQRLPHLVALLQQRLRSAHHDNILALLTALEAKDSYTERHSANVAVYAEHLGRRMGLSAGDLEVLTVAAILHDIGKIGVPDAVLNKPGRLTADEMAVMKTHCELGAAILRPVAFLQRQAPLVVAHHEWYDGSGYPMGLKGEDIPFLARVVQAADCIDAMISPRLYKEGFSDERVIAELNRGTGRQFDPRVAVEAAAWLQQRPDQIIRPA